MNDADVSWYMFDVNVLVLCLCVHWAWVLFLAFAAFLQRLVENHARAVGEVDGNLLTRSIDVCVLVRTVTTLTFT